MGFEFLDLNSNILQLKPKDLNFLARKFIVPASTGVMLGNLISSLANRNSLNIGINYSLSKSFIEVLDLVFSSTCLIITAQFSEGAFGFFLSGSEPGTITEYGGIFP